MSPNVSKVDRVFCLIHTSYFLDKFCIHTKNECWHKIHIIYGVVLDQKHRWYWRKKLKNCAPLMGCIFFLFSSFFSGRESERKLAVLLAPSSELPSDSSWTSGPPDTLTRGHLDDLAPDKKCNLPTPHVTSFGRLLSVKSCYWTIFL